jgi:hypothetical protein
MPPTPYIDRLDTLSYVERHGAIRSLTRKVRVKFQDFDQPRDFSVLSVAMTTIEADPHGMKPFSIPLDINGNPLLGYNDLRLVERSPSLAENDPSTVDIILKYEHVLDGPNQDFSSDIGIIDEDGTPLTDKVLYAKGKASIVEKTTNFFISPELDPTDPNNREQISVSYTFPISDMGIAGMPLMPGIPRTVEQGGEVNIPFPQENFTLVGFLRTATPRRTANLFIAKVNADTWLEKPPFTWICSEVQWEMMLTDTKIGYPWLGTPLYKFQFEFQYNIDTWKPTVVFLDQRTGRPPAGVVDQVATSTDEFNVLRLRDALTIGGATVLVPAAMWQVPCLQTVNFPALFASEFET